MNPATPRILAIAAAAAASLAIPAQAQPSQVAPLDVTLKPTSIVLNVASTDVRTVRQAIRLAANTVCSNAVDNHELSFLDTVWCADTAAFKANRRYDRIRHAMAFAQGAQPVALALQIAAPARRG